jgi:hypothetical protein
MVDRHDPAGMIGIPVRIQAWLPGMHMVCYGRGKLRRTPGACPAYRKLRCAGKINVGTNSQRDDRGGNTMNRRSVITMGLVLAGSAVFWHAHDAIGRLLEGGVVQADVGSGFLVTKQEYGDFQLRAEFWVDPTANSGIFIRATDPKRVTGQNAYEVNIFDTRPDPSYGTGAIVNVAKVSPMPKAANRWNTYDITAKGGEFTVILNGIKTVDGAKDSKFAKGRIALQYGGGIVRFRMVEIRPL